MRGPALDLGRPTSPPPQHQSRSRCPSYLDVSAEVGDFAAACSFQVVISPPQQELLGGELHQVLQTLPFPQKGDQG